MPTPRETQHIKVVADGIDNTRRLLGLDGPTYDGRPVITEDQANACLTVVRTLLGTDEATLYPPGHEGPMWVISLEGWEDWTIRLAAIDGAFPDGVFAEPVNHWCLALYPA